MAVIDWNTRADQLEALVLREVDVRSYPSPFYSLTWTCFTLRNTLRFSNHSARTPRHRWRLSTQCKYTVMRRPESWRRSHSYSRYFHSRLLFIEPGLTVYHNHFSACEQILYNKDSISAQAIIYWHQKGAKPQGKQHFLKTTEALVKVSLIRLSILAHFFSRLMTWPLLVPRRTRRRERRRWWVDFCVYICYLISSTA